MPTLNHFILLSLIGIFGGVANLWLSQSYKYSEVSLVTPLKYLTFSVCYYFWIFYLGRNTYNKNINRGVISNCFNTYNF